MSKRLFDSFQPLKPPLWDQYCTVLWPNSHPNSDFYSLSNYFPTSRISATVWMNPSPLHGTTSGTMKFGVPAFIAFKPLRWPSIRVQAGSGMGRVGIGQPASLFTLDCLFTLDISLSLDCLFKLDISLSLDCLFTLDYSFTLDISLSLNCLFTLDCLCTLD